MFVPPKRSVTSLNDCFKCGNTLSINGHGRLVCRPCKLNAKTV